MHIHFADPYRAGTSVLHELDARVKFVLVIAFILTTALTPVGAWPVYVLLLSLVLSATLLSDLGIGHVLKRASLALPFVLAALPLLFTVEGRPLLVIPIAAWTLTFTAEGLARFASIALKSWLSVQAAIILVESTPFTQLLIAMRAVKVPRLLVAIFSLMWRYLFVLADEVLRLLRARASRSGHSGEPGKRPGGTLVWRAQVTGGMAGNLFLRSFERGDRIYVAMLARGYDGEVRSFAVPPLTVAHWIVLGAGLAVLGLLLAFAYLIWS
ncbi:MAG: cobalt ECF transporter T component CbiQ [Chloroflexi bacterium]|nr:cobalt ECF transporter T component CbiQ [Chloroflexota bacterium]